MLYDYNMQKLFTQTVEVDDSGNCCLECETPDGDFYYLKTQSIMGMVYCLKFGPIMPDLDVLDSDFCLEYRKFKYSQKSIDKEINGFINDPKKGITEVRNTDEMTIMNAIPERTLFIPV